MSEIQEEKLKEEKQLNEEDQAYLLEKMFDYQREQHTPLLQNISETRNVANYVVTAVLVFTGFVLSSDNNFISTTTPRKIVFYGILTCILLIWVKINWSMEISVGFKPDSILQSISNKETKLNIWDKILKNSSKQYKHASSILAYKLEVYKKMLLVLAVVFFILTIIFLNFKTITI